MPNHNGSKSFLDMEPTMLLNFLSLILFFVLTIWAGILGIQWEVYLKSISLDLKLLLLWEKCYLELNPWQNNLMFSFELDEFFNFFFDSVFHKSFSNNLSLEGLLEEFFPRSFLMKGENSGLLVNVLAWGGFNSNC